LPACEPALGYERVQVRVRVASGHAVSAASTSVTFTVNE
jgi:hypothetical protein